MPRKLRVEFPGAIYHVMSRGDRREDILRDDVDRQDFLKTLAETCQKTGFEVHAYCLMGNHFHRWWKRRRQTWWRECAGS
jgi:REP element-mobilizing transposase RayT